MERVTASNYRRIAPLIEHDLPLYVSHLPSTATRNWATPRAWPTCSTSAIGNRSARSARKSSASAAPPASPTPSTNSGTLLADELDTGDGEVRALGFGPDEIRDIAIVTGSGVDWLGEAADAGVDALVTGEGKQKAFHEAREAGLNVVMAGHYATETFGVQSLQSLVEEWGLETTFLDHPTGL